jgi:hypothetical protein
VPVAGLAGEEPGWPPCHQFVWKKHQKKEEGKGNLPRSRRGEGSTGDSGPAAATVLRGGGSVEREERKGGARGG